MLKNFQVLFCFKHFKMTRFVLLAFIIIYGELLLSNAKLSSSLPSLNDSALKMTSPNNLTIETPKKINKPSQVKESPFIPSNDLLLLRSKLSGTDKSATKNSSKNVTSITGHRKFSKVFLLLLHHHHHLLNPQEASSSH